MHTTRLRRQSRAASAVLLALLAILLLATGILMASGGQSGAGISAGGESPYPYPMHSRFVPVVFSMPAPAADADAMP